MRTLADTVGPLQMLRLRRRRSRLPWVFSVYHAAPRAPDAETLSHKGGLSLCRRRSAPRSRVSPSSRSTCA